MNWSWPWKGLFRELVEVRGNEAQLTQYMAVLAGIRRSMDDWIPVLRLDAYRRLATKLGLVVQIDCVFKPLTEPARVLGVDTVPTTRAVSTPYPSGLDNDPRTRVHVIVSTRADWAAETLAAAWYSTAVGDRIVHKPLIDHLRLGRAFGYPECCVQFFVCYNNWPQHNTLAEAAKASARMRWETNCLAKQTPWTAIYHLPCAFDCPATCDYAAAVLAAVGELDFGYTQRIESFLRQHFLTTSEVHCYALLGSRPSTHGRVAYSQAIYLRGDRHYDWYGHVLAQGNEIGVSEGMLFVWNDGQLIEALETRCDRGIIEVPLLLNFE